MLRITQQRENDMEVKNTTVRVRPDYLGTHPKSRLVSGWRSRAVSDASNTLSKHIAEGGCQYARKEKPGGAKNAL